MDVAAPGVSIYSTTPQTHSELFNASYDTGDGTSFSAPLVAGEAALLLAADPTTPLADLRAAVINSAHGFAGLGLGTGRVDFRAAFDHRRPTGAPQLTAPTNGGIVAGVIAISAASSAPTVRFQVDGTWLGTAAAPINGIAGATWATWGLTNGTHRISALQCSVSGVECATSAATISVSISNNAPTVTGPDRRGQRCPGSSP